MVSLIQIERDLLIDLNELLYSLDKFISTREDFQSQDLRTHFLIHLIAFTAFNSYLGRTFDVCIEICGSFFDRMLRLLYVWCSTWVREQHNAYLVLKFAKFELFVVTYLH